MWEKIDDHSSRLLVPGGWVIRYWESAGNSIGPGVGVSVAMIFVNDVTHEWKLREVK